MRNDITRSDGFFIRCLAAVFYTGIIGFSYLLPFYTQWPSPYDSRNLSALLGTFPLLFPISLIILSFNDGFFFAHGTKRGAAAKSAVSAVMIAASVAAVAFFQRDFAVPRSIILQSAMMQWLLFTALQAIFTRLHLSNHAQPKRLFIGLDSDRQTLLNAALATNLIKPDDFQFVHPDDPSVYEYFTRSDEIYLASSISSEYLANFLKQSISSGQTLYLVPKTYEIAILNAELLHLDDIPLFRINSLTPSFEKQVIKRATDLIISTTVLIILCPLMLMIALGIKIQDGGPIFYRQKRVTRNNHIFSIIKFRSMILDAEKHTGPILSSSTDPRVTPFGRLLRRFWLDELPQLFNVIAGDMSLVGPRPERPEFIASFSKDIPHFTYRLAVKAGVTGLAQVMGRYSITPEHKIKYDLIYIRNMSLLYDLRILLSTFKMILFGTLERTSLPQTDTPQ